MTNSLRCPIFLRILLRKTLLLLVKSFPNRKKQTCFSKCRFYIAIYTWSLVITNFIKLLFKNKNVIKLETFYEVNFMKIFIKIVFIKCVFFIIMQNFVKSLTFIKFCLFIKVRFFIKTLNFTKLSYSFFIKWTLWKNVYIMSINNVILWKLNKCTNFVYSKPYESFIFV